MQALICRCSGVDQLIAASSYSVLFLGTLSRPVADHLIGYVVSQSTHLLQKITLFIHWCHSICLKIMKTGKLPNVQRYNVLFYFILLLVYMIMILHHVWSSSRKLTGAWDVGVIVQKNVQNNCGLWMAKHWGILGSHHWATLTRCWIMYHRRKRQNNYIHIQSSVQ